MVFIEKEHFEFTFNYFNILDFQDKVINQSSHKMKSELFKRLMSNINGTV